MTISDHLQRFAGKKVVNWEPTQRITYPSRRIFRIAVSYDDSEAGTTWTDKFAAFLHDPAVGQVTGLVVGPWDYAGDDVTSEQVVEVLTTAREQLPRLTAIFLGDITFEENEISWIRQSDVSPLFNAYPGLKHFGVRGGNGLHLGTIALTSLETLIVESGGLASDIAGEVMRSTLPRLDHLELWIGTEDYGRTTTVADLEPLLTGAIFPNLRYLGLRDADIADEIAVALASAPLLERIRTLDLSLGTFGDVGAAALVACPAVSTLEKLDIHHHYCSVGMVAQLQSLGITVDASEPELQDGDDTDQWRYVAVGE